MHAIITITSPACRQIPRRISRCFRLCITHLRLHARLQRPYKEHTWFDIILIYFRVHTERMLLPPRSIKRLFRRGRTFRMVFALFKYRLSPIMTMPLFRRLALTPHITGQQPAQNTTSAIMSYDRHTAFDFALSALVTALGTGYAMAHLDLTLALLIQCIARRAKPLFGHGRTSFRYFALRTTVPLEEWLRHTMKYIHDKGAFRADFYDGAFHTMPIADASTYDALTISNELARNSVFVYPRRACSLLLFRFLSMLGDMMLLTCRDLAGFACSSPRAQ